MKDSQWISAGLKCLAAKAEHEANRSWYLDPIVAAMRKCLVDGGTLFFCGNGGSAADAQHIAAEYVVRYRGPQKPLRAIALTTDTSILTATANDCGFMQVFSRQLAALARPGDVLIVHSTSGNSENCIAAVNTARTLNVGSIAFLGNDGGKLAGLVDYSYIVRDERTCHIQEIHLAVQHQIAEILTKEFSQ